MAGNEMNYILIRDWMIEEMKLTGNDVIIYAIIHSFSQGEEWFHGSLAYLERRTGLSRQSVITILTSLVKGGYLLRKEIPYKNIKYVNYKAVRKWSRNLTSKDSGLVKNLSKGSQETRLEVVKKLDPIINNNKNIIKNARAREYLDFPQRDLDYDEIENKLLSIPYRDDIETR